MSITTKEHLKNHYGPVSELATAKELTKLDKHLKHFIALSPFIVIATSDKTGKSDASPKGDAPGFVEVIDDKTILIPDRIGNNRTDTLTNILENPEVGLIFFIPGLRETMRINGSCEIVDDPNVLKSLSAQNKPPRSAIKVTIREAYMHCGKAVIRAKLWADDYKIEKGDFPSLGQVLSDQIENTSSDDADETVELSYKQKLY